MKCFRLKWHAWLSTVVPKSVPIKNFMDWLASVSVNSTEFGPSAFVKNSKIWYAWFMIVFPSIHALFSIILFIGMKPIAFVTLLNSMRINCTRTRCHGQCCNAFVYLKTRPRPPLVSLSKFCFKKYPRLWVWRHSMRDSRTLTCKNRLLDCFPETILVIPALPSTTLPVLIWALWRMLIVSSLSY